MKSYSPYLWCLSALLLSVILGAAVGSVPIPVMDVVWILAARLLGLNLPESWAATSETILLSIRLPRTALVALTGAALAGSGAAYQGVFRNPLADPYLMGVASGAGLGAVAAMTFLPMTSLTGLLAVPLAAFLGGLATVALVYGLAHSGKTAPVTTLILAGVAVSAFAASLTTFLMLRSQDSLRRAVVWMLGGFTLGGWLPVLALLPYLGLGLAVLIALGRVINVLQFGEEQALQMGLDVERAKLILVGAASLTAAGAVAFSGIIGFAGLAVPHLVRRLWGPDYQRLLPLAAISGAALLVLADIFARIILAPEELPLGVVTAMTGAPFFLWLLRKTRQQM